MENQLTIQIAVLFVSIVCCTLLFLFCFPLWLPGTYSNSDDRFMAILAITTSVLAFILTPEATSSFKQLIPGIVAYLCCTFSFIMIIIIFATRRPHKTLEEMLDCSLQQSFHNETLTGELNLSSSRFFLYKYYSCVIIRVCKINFMCFL